MMLKQRIISDDNIFLSVYLADSYILNKELLKGTDRELLFQLKDPFNVQYITNIIKKVKKRLKSILEDDADFFTVFVFFKPKEFDAESGQAKFRPLHTASLIDQICMVAMLLTLVYQFEDNNRIIPSELSRLLPADFYGNRIEFNGERLFKPWSKQYGQYTQKIIELSKEYGESKEYLYEVDLDLKNFFPSVHPAVLENILIDNLPLSYDEDDRKTYKTVVRKLLVFRLDQKKALDQEEKEWYLNGKSYAHTELLFAKGIPQGLPHTYFFANLFMLRVKAIYEKVLPGKMLFYVDDSVIFTNGKSGTLSAESVNEAINQINYWLKKRTVPHSRECLY